MTTAAASIVNIALTEQRYAPYDAAHGTPDPMVRRLLTISLPAGAARFEQTDYGHPGRFNPWEPRGIDGTLQPRTPDLLALCEAISPLLR
ncbi:MAG: hypothetical protein EPO22_09585 [Dehalococcoidia bacterium]|nr:MAG: hypothetical protein EPO22_09585 [Dehalococcoidia bacterium]